MPDEERPGLADRVVERLAELLNAVGFNGTRLLWKWRQKRRNLAESSMRSEMLLRSARGRHRMCPSCRALIDRKATKCPECEESLAGRSTPGLGRVVTNILPGVTAAASLIMLVNGFWFALMLMAQIRSGSGAASPSLFGGFDLELMARFGAGVSRPRLLPDGVLVGGEWWRFVTPIFLHGGLLHFVFNSYLLIQLGPIVEEIYGTPRFWTIYLTCGIAGTLASELPRYVITVGASGAIMGLIGLLMAYGYRHGNVLGQSVKQLLIRLAIYSVVLSLFFNIDHLNHAGGLICGAILGFVVPSGSPRRGEASFWNATSAACVILVLYAFYQVAAQGRLASGA